MPEHIQFEQDNLELILLDQRKLPSEEIYYHCSSPEEVIDAIKNMTVRGAPALGVTGAYGCILCLKKVMGLTNWREELKNELQKLSEARPTAVNLSWAVQKMLSKDNPAYTAKELLQEWIKEACAIQAEDIKINKTIGNLGASLLNDGDTVLTHCNAGALATGGYGTALGVIKAAHGQGKNINVIADETRPLLQGGRLTAWELAKADIPVKVTCDNGAALLLKNKMVQAVIVGADRIAANGDTANKIGTLSLAIIANYYKVPFYVAAPLSTFDFTLATGEEIVLENRDDSEVCEMAGKRLVPPGVKAFNFAFDITPADLITAIITERGVIKAPVSQNIHRLQIEKN